ncbi:MAG: FtsK/SpoIIIE domain-containing protein, partial [Tepidisphaeraceae bacterium]
PTGVPFRRQSGANLLIIGQQEESAMAVMCAAVLGLGAQLPASGPRFIVLDGSAADSPLTRVLPQVGESLPHNFRMTEYRAATQAIDELSRELTARQSAPDANAAPIFLCIYGLQRYRALRKQEENFGFSNSDDDKPPATDKQFAEILREGPSLGIHTIAWVDTSASLDRTLERGAMREFDHRVLFQMSATDSSNVIDSPLANKLGAHRGLYYSEEQGVMEKFRPYALPDKQWLSLVAKHLRR